MILYGSYARGKAGSRADVDMVMILKNYDRDFVEIDRTSEIVARQSLAYDTTVALIPLREQDWREKQSPFLYTVRREGVESQ